MQWPIICKIANAGRYELRRISKTAGLCFLLAYIVFLMWQIGVVSFV